MKDNKIVVISAILSLLIMLCLYLDHNGYFKPSEGLISSDTVVHTKTDTVYKTDTFRLEKPVPKYIEKLRVDTFFTEKGDTIQLTTENKVYQDTLICDKDTAELQIFTSGINAEVDSVNLNLRKSERIITNTVTITNYVEKPKKLLDRFHIQPQATFGYDPLNKKWGLVVGIGVGVDI